MPDLERSRRVKLAEEISLQTPSGQRTKGASSQRMLKVEAQEYEIPEGLSLEIDPVMHEAGGVVDFNLFVEFARKDGRDVRISRLSVASVAQLEVPTLLMRWQEGQTDRILMATFTETGGASPSPVPSEALDVLYVDTTLYESASDASAARDAVGRIVFPSRTGQRAKGEDYVPVTYEVGGRLADLNTGLTVEIDPALDSATRTLDLTASIEFTEEGSGTERDASGERFPRMEIRRSLCTSESFKNGDTKTLPMKLFSLVDTTGQADDWQAVVTYLHHQVGN